MKRALVAFGGNALIRAKEVGLQSQQIENAKEAAEMVVNLLGQGVLPILVHGNGPQVGNLLIQQEEASNRVPPYTMDICGAQTQGSMGYILQRCIENMLRLKSLEIGVASVLTEVVVDRRDPGFLHPTKPVGPFYEAFRAHNLEVEKGWIMKEDAGRGWRRLVASPKPLRIVQGAIIERLVGLGLVVIACGGGGIPVIEDPSGFLIGVEAVIDKDRTSALLARQVGADTLIILTEVEHVALDFGTTNQRDLSFLSLSDAKKYLADGQFPPGSMGPKIESAITFIESGGCDVIITTAQALLRGDVTQVGTHIAKD